MKQFLYTLFGIIFTATLALNAFLLRRIGNEARIAEEACMAVNAHIASTLQDMHNALPADVSEQVKDIQNQIYKITPADEPEKI